MNLTRRIWIQLAVVAVVMVVGVALMFFPVLKLPANWFGVGRYFVTVQLPQAGGLYERANVTYRGYNVGQVKSVQLTDTGVEAVMSMDSDVKIPSDVDAEVHSVSAIGEQYVDLLPRSADGPMLRNGDVIPSDRTTVPPNISSLLDATNKGLQAIPREDLKTVVDEAYVAFGGLGPELARFVKGATALALDARANINELTTLVDESKPVLDSQIDTSDSIQAWAANLATVTEQLRTEDGSVAKLLQDGAPAADEARALFDRLQPTLPIVLANLVTVGEVAAVYRGNIEQLLVLLPQGAASIQAVGVANRNTKQDYNGGFLSFNLNLNLPPACNTGFLPAQQIRGAALEDYPPPPDGDLYCRVPQDAPFNVRGARNTPCVEKPGKRAPTVDICESDEDYVPLNDGYNWKGDPNATLSGQGVPQPRDPSAPGSGPLVGAPPPPPSGPAPAPIATVPYDPATGTYVGPDGRVYTQSDLAVGAQQGQTWQNMLVPPTGNWTMRRKTLGNNQIRAVTDYSVEMTGSVVRQSDLKDPSMSCQQTSPVAVYVPLESDAGMMTSDVAQPGNLLQLPWLMGVDKHTVTPVTCAFGVHVFGVRVARTDLAPPGSMTSSGDVSVYWQSAAPEDPSAGEPDANAVLPPIADMTTVAITADVNSERRTIIPAF